MNGKGKVWLIFVSVLCMIGFLAVSVVFNVFPLGDMPAAFVGAALGAVITAVVTALQLSSQSGAEELKERNVEVFKKKSEIFSEYIDAVWQAWEDRKLSAEEYKDLVGNYYKKLMLYMKKTSADSVGESLMNIGHLANKEDDMNEKDEETLLNSFIKIINILGEEISLGGQVEVDPKLFKNLDKEVGEAKARSRSSNRSFATLGIKRGTELVLKRNPEVICITVDDKNLVRYKGDELKISALATRELGRSANGFAEFTVNGKSLMEPD